MTWSTLSVELSRRVDLETPVVHLQGGVGRIPELMVEGLVERGGRIEYKANVRKILTEAGPDGQERAVGVQLADGRVYRCAGQARGAGGGVPSDLCHFGRM